MDDVKRAELETKLRNVLKQHQLDGLHMVGGVDQLIARLVRAVEEWSEGKQLERKSA